MKDGRLGMDKKYKGKMHKVVESYVRETLQEYNNYDDSVCFITYSTATPEMLEAVKTVLKEEAHFKEVIETHAGCTVATHCGPNTLGIIYYNGQEK